MKSTILPLILILGTFTTVLKAQTQLNLLSTWSDSTLVGSNVYDNIYNEVWGYTINNSEFAIVGSTAGTHFINVTDPSNVYEAFFVEGGTSDGQIIHRDFHDNQGYLYGVADEGPNSTLQIIDLKDLPNSIDVVYDSNAFIRRTHNIFIDSSSNVMYACISSGTELPFARLRTFDISDPTNPQVIKEYNVVDGFFFQQVHDAYVIRDTAYLNCGPGGFAIVDFTDRENPSLLFDLEPQDYPQSGYNHSGWLSEDGNTYIMADEDHGKEMKVFDATNKNELELIGFLNAGSDSQFSIPHNQIIHENYLFASYYYDGIQVYNMVDPQNITRDFYYETSNIEARESYEGAWGVYPFLPSGNILVTDMQNGLFVLEGPSPISSSNEIEAHDLQVTISPNPNSGKFILQLDGDAFNGSAVFELYTLSGRKVFSKNIGASASSININTLEPSAYYYSLSSPQYRKTGKLIVIN